jgi:hypothetical protein
MDHYIAIAIVFAAAIYLILHFRNQFNVNKGCASGCNSCPTESLKRIEKNIKKDAVEL